MWPLLLSISSCDFFLGGEIAFETCLDQSKPHLRADIVPAERCTWSSRSMHVVTCGQGVCQMLVLY